VNSGFKMLKEIKFTTLENQSKSMNEYSRSLTPQQRWDLLMELNQHAFWKELSEPISVSKEVRIFTKRESESLPDFFERARSEKS